MHVAGPRRREAGITGIETAIVLIAFVVIAAVFAFTLLGLGLFGSERGKAAIYGGLQKTRGSLALNGDVLATSNGTQLTDITFTVALAAGGDSVNLDPAASTGRTVISYTDGVTANNDLAYTTAVLVGDADDLVEPGEMFEVNVDLTQDGSISVDGNDRFALEVKPPSGAVLVIQRVAPPGVSDTIIDLH